MNDLQHKEHLAFQATYSDWKLVKGRKVIQIVLEIPLELEHRAYEVLGGMPDPAQSVWCAVARMTGRQQELSPKTETTHTHHEEKPASDPNHSRARAPTSWDEMPAAQQAGILCADRNFQEFLDAANPNEAKRVIYDRCSIQSRAQLLPGTSAIEIWKQIVSEYRHAYQAKIRQHMELMR